MPGHNLQPWAPREKAVLCFSVQGAAWSPHPACKVSSLVKTFGTCRRREGWQNLAMGRHAWHADRACSWWAEAGVCPSWALLHAGLKRQAARLKIRPRGDHSGCRSLRSLLRSPGHAKDPWCYMGNTSTTDARLLLAQPKSMESELGNCRHHLVQPVISLHRGQSCNPRPDIQRITRSANAPPKIAFQHSHFLPSPQVNATSKVQAMVLPWIAVLCSPWPLLPWPFPDLVTGPPQNSRHKSRICSRYLPC